jgi:hypothetical protein
MMPTRAPSHQPAALPRVEYTNTRTFFTRRLDRGMSYFTPLTLSHVTRST